MTPINWTHNEIIKIHCDDYRIMGRTTAGDMNLEHVVERRFEVRTEAELARLWESGELVRDRDPEGVLGPALEINLTDLPAELREEVKRLHAYVDACLKRKARSRGAKSLLPIIHKVALARGEKGPCVRTIQRALARWYSVGASDLRDPRILVARRSSQGNRTERLHPDVVEIIDDIINTDALKPNRPTGRQMHRSVLRRVGDANKLRGDKPPLNHPSLRAVYRRLEVIDREVLLRGRKGVLAAENAFKPVEAGPQGDAPLSDVEIDHTILDVLVICAKTKTVIGRPTITVALCRKTRMIVGVYIGFEPPSYRTVAACLRSAIRPKTALLADYPSIQNDWLAYGVPTRLHLDNGPEFHSESLLDACRQLKIEIAYCPRRKPRFKGKVERWFGRLAREVIHQLPGTTFSDPKQRGDYDAKGQAAVTLGNLREMVLKWIVDDYQVSVHRGIEEAPVECWKREVRSNPVSLPAHAGELDVLLDDVHYATLDQRGIQFRNLRYNCRELRPLISAADRPDVCKFKVDPENLGRIRLWDFRHSSWIVVPALDPAYAEGLSLGEHNYITSHVRTGLKKYERTTIAKLIDAREWFRTQVRELNRNSKGFSKALRASLAEEGDIRVFCSPTEGEVPPAGPKLAAAPVPAPAATLAVVSQTEPTSSAPQTRPEAALSREEKRAALRKQAGVTVTHVNLGG